MSPSVGVGPVPAAGAPVPPLPLPPLEFCIPPNPTVGVLRSHAELGLRKLRSGRNISGILREVPAYAAPTDTVTGMPVAANGQISLPSVRAVPPTAYRYSVLIARVKELAQQAAQIEPQYLGAIERLEDATFTQMQARQALTLAGAETQLETLRVNQANDGVTLAQQQTQRVLIQQQTYQAWIASGLNEYEQAMLELYGRAAFFQGAQAAAAALVQTAQAVTTAATASAPAAVAAAAGAVAVGVFAGTGAAAAIGAAVVNRDIQTNALLASQQRRVDEWRLQAALATQDLQIGKLQEGLAQDEVAISVQQKSIADTRERQARDTVEFLANRFTGPDLWDFMIGIYGDVYRTLLQKAAAELNVAKAQLGFERQEDPPIAISADYWSAPSSTATPPAASPADDRRGLTGSARLLADLYELDQYAFDTNKRKLGVTKTVSLAQLAPAEFEKFRETGVITFATPAELFDRDFPGLYLRLIRRVRASVIALIPPVEGIRATLATTGISRVVVGPEPFQTVAVRREPETVALSVPIGGTGVFEGDAQGDMYLPFEGNGVDSTWELRLPWAANRFDRDALSDVLISFDYLALNNYDYGRTVIERLKPEVHTDLALSIKNDFPDAWYDLNNPELLQEPQRFILRLRVSANDIPANLDHARLENVAVRLSSTDTALQTFTVASLKRTDTAAGVASTGGSVRAIDGVISTRNGNGSPWQPLVGGGAGGPSATPFGDWELSLRSPEPADIPALQDALSAGRLTDIQLVLTYAADTPPWPD
jgi:hypothetical protein